jgi:AcrR family transcriptional regulator
MGQVGPAGRSAVGRGPRMRAAVLAATLAELAERGYAALTVDTVARRAGVHKTSIYRRWGDRESLVVDALSEHIAIDIPMPDTGAVASDLRLMARALVRWTTSTAGQAIVAALLTDAVQSPELADARRRIFDERLRRAEPVIARAVARGELPPETDPAEVVKSMAAPIYFRLLITGEPLDEDIADRAAEIALVTANAGALRATGRERPA